MKKICFFVIYFTNRKKEINKNFEILIQKLFTHFTADFLHLKNHSDQACFRGIFNGSFVLH